MHGNRIALNIGLMLNIICSVAIMILGVKALEMVSPRAMSCETWKLYWCSWQENPLTFFMFNFLVGIFFFALPLLSIFFSIMAKNKERYMMVAGILGIMTSVIGGILVIVNGTKKSGVKQLRDKTESVLTIIACVFIMLLGIVPILILIYHPLARTFISSSGQILYKRDYIASTLLGICIWLFFFQIPLLLIAFSIRKMDSEKQRRLNY